MNTRKILIGSGVAAAVLAVMMPVSAMAVAKLRKRDLSAILEGCGWAINARMRLTFAQGRMFTETPAYPDGARGVPTKRARTVPPTPCIAGCRVSP